jgi:hypothetical protein
MSSRMSRSVNSRRSTGCTLSTPTSPEAAKSHHQAVFALARRRINVLHAILRTRQPNDSEHAAAA